MFPKHIFKGVVTSIFDDFKQCIIKAVFPEVSQDVVDVIYTSPYYIPNGGGMLAVPEEGSQILVYRDEDTLKYYYLTTIVQSPENSQTGGDINFNLISDKVYSERGRPQRVSFANQVDSGLHITRKYLPNKIVNKVDLVSEKGKKLSLNDSPKSDAVILRNEHGDGLIISGDANDVHPDRSVELKSKGYQRFVVFQSDMSFLVVDGREVNIENESSGAFSNSANNSKFGNINIRSKHSDITLVCKGDESKIFLITPKARLEITKDGDILISTTGNLEIKSQGDINMAAQGNINLESQGDVQIKANQNVKTIASGGQVSILGASIASMDAGQVHLNSGLQLPETPVQLKQEDKTDYNE